MINHLKLKLALFFTLVLSSAGIASAQECALPTPPPNVSIEATSPYTATFRVDPVSGPSVGYLAEREQEDVTEFSVINSGYPNGVFFDTQKLLPGQTFCYRTRARNACNEYSGYSEIVMVTMPDGPMPYMGAPAVPTSLSIAPYNGHAKASWTAGAFPGVPGQTQAFQIHRSDSASFTNPVPLGSTNNTFWVDNTAVSGHTYYYRVRAFNGFAWATGFVGSCGPTRTDCGTGYTNVASISIP